MSETPTAATSPTDYEAQVRQVLDAVYFPAGVQLWLTAPNHHFAMSSPASLILAGRGAEVLAYATRLGGSGW